MGCNAAKKTKQDKNKPIKPNNPQISIQKKEYHGHAHRSAYDCVVVFIARDLVILCYIVFRIHCDVKENYDAGDYAGDDANDDAGDDANDDADDDAVLSI